MYRPTHPEDTAKATKARAEYLTEAMKAWRARRSLLHPFLAGDAVQKLPRVDRETEVYKLAELISSKAPEICSKWCTGICEFALWAPKILSLNEQETLHIVLNRLAEAMHEVSVMSVYHLADANINANRIQASLLFLGRFLHTPRHCFICVLCFFPHSTTGLSNSLSTAWYVNSPPRSFFGECSLPVGDRSE